MISHGSDRNLYLIEAADVRAGATAAGRHHEALRATLGWVESFLMQPHADLGRAGIVCPFVGPAIERDVLWMTVYDGDHSDASYDSALCRYRDWFQEIEPRSGVEAGYKVLLMLFPDLPQAPGTDGLEATCERSKAEMDARKMASLACYATCDKPGLRRDDFRPFQAPVPFIGVRNIVQCDIFSIRNRVDLEVYWRIFGADLPTKYRPVATQLAQRFGVDLNAVAAAGSPPAV